MGASQSKLPEPVIEEKLVERLRALDVKEGRAEAEKDYVYVDDSRFSPTKYSPTVSVSTAEQWEKELLEDPKVITPLIPQHYKPSVADDSNHRTVLHFPLYPPTTQPRFLHSARPRLQIRRPSMLR